MTQVTMHYQGHSQATEGHMTLATLAGPEPGAFCATLLRPQTFRTALLALGQVVQANDEFEDEEHWRARVLDPVVGIHPDGVSFEAFSQDCSTLGWVHLCNTAFGPPLVHQGGCTSIDYSQQLEKCLLELTPASKLKLTIGTAHGVKLEQAGKTHHEKRIDLPEGWLRGFGELHAGLLQADITLPLTRADLFNILRAAQRKAPAKLRGRALVFDLEPGERAVVHVEPWDTIIRLQSPPPALDEPLTLKIYGRRRLKLLESLIPHVESARLHLSGSARPSYWELQLPDARMILAMSSWTARKFTQSFAESLRGAAAPVDDAMLRQAAAFMADTELASLEELSEELGLSPEQAKGVALALCRQGLVITEPQGRAIRWRPLHHLPFDQLNASQGQTTREHNATELIAQGKLQILEITEHEGLSIARARCEGRAGLYSLSLWLQPDGSFAQAQCTCKWMQKNNNDLRGGPCKHLLALREQVLNTSREHSNHA